MKKAIGITALVLVIATILTICFGVGLGSAAIRSYWTGGYKDINSAIRNAIVFGDDFDWDIEKQEYLRESTGTTCEKSAGDTAYSIGADVAKIVVVGTDDKDMTATLKIYSSTADYNEEKYTLTTLGSEYDAYVSCDETIKESTIAVLVVNVPKEACETLKITSSIGDVEISGINVENLDIDINIGNLEIENSSANNVDIAVDTGDIELAETFNVKRHLNASINIGELGFELPKSYAFKLSYKGLAELSDELDYSAYKTVNDNGGVSGLTGSGTIEYNPNRIDSADLVSITLSCSVGKIDID